MAKRTKLDRLIAHYSLIARDGNRLLTSSSAHYAAGVRDALLAVRRIRDEYRAEQADLWRLRQGQAEGDPGRVAHRIVRKVADELDAIEDPGVMGTVGDPLRSAR